MTKQFRPASVNKRIKDMVSQSDASDNVKDYLLWVLDFERTHLDEQRPRFIEDFQAKADRYSQSDASSEE